MKYMGSKSRLSKEISEIINNLILKNGIKLYIEPFVGGCNLIEKIECDKKIGSDLNVYLIEMWKKIQLGWTPPDKISKDFYEEIKNNKEKFSKELVSIAGFCATYNAKWFGGYAGIVKTKNGEIRNYYEESIRNILKQKENLKDVIFINSDYKHFTNTENSLIYCDPPYLNTTNYAFQNEFNNNEFWEWVRVVSNKNIVLVSEYSAPVDFECIFEKQITTTLDKNSRKKDTEKLFVLKGEL